MQSLDISDPAHVGRHKLLGRLGQGGMGVVYLAEGPAGRVAIKVVRPELAADPQFRDRFQREVQACFRLRGKFTAELLDFDTTAPAPWLATEYVDAPNLEELIEAAGPLDFEGQQALALGLAEALVTLHEAGVVHRDLKPPNVMCPATGPKVIDFGIAAAADASRVTATSQMVGTLAWMAPERFDGDAGPPADIFAWAGLVAYAATGRAPFESASAVQLMYQLTTQPPDVNVDELAPALREPVAAAFSKDPAERPTALQLRDALLADATSIPTQAAGPDEADVLDATTRLLGNGWAGHAGQPPNGGIRSETTATTAARRPSERRRGKLLAVAVIAVLVVLAAILTPLLVTSGSSSGHTFKVDPELNAVAVSPNGDDLVTGSDQVKLWDLDTGRLIRGFQDSTGTITDVAVTPDGQHVAGAFADGHIGVWDLSTGKLLRTLQADSERVGAVTVTPDAAALVSGSDDGTVRVWNLNNGRVIHTLRGHTQRVDAVAVSPNDTTIVTGSDDGSVRVWNLASGALIRKIAAFTDHVDAVAVTSDSRKLLAGSNDDQILVWDLGNGRLLRDLGGFTDGVSAMASTPGGKRVVAGAYDRTVRIWDLGKGTLLRTITHGTYPADLTITPDGKQVVAGYRDGTIGLWDIP